MQIVSTNSTDLDRWIAERHYLKSAPAGARLRLWVLDNGGNYIGAMMWGRPTARSLDQSELLELTRMYLIDETDHCAESQALALARKHIRKHLPTVKGLIAYASTGQEHDGTIYRADGWFALGLTAKRRQGWSSRPGRGERDTTQKIRYVRTP